MLHDPGQLLFRNSGTLRGKRVLITGGCGFVGSHIADELSGLGCKEIVLVDNLVRGRLDNVSEAVARGNVRIVHGDIRDGGLLDSLLPDTDVVFHQAALRITHCAAEPRVAFEVMATATFDLLEKCVSHRVSKVVMASSASIYGMASTFPTVEAHPPYENRTLYGACKSFGESLLRSFHEMYGLNYIALRYFNVYGPRMDIHGKYTEVLIRWMERIAGGQPPIIFGDGLQTLDMIDVRDVARSNVLAALSEVPDVVLNIGTGRETTLLCLGRLLASIMGRPDLEPQHQAERSVNPVARRLADTTQANRMIGFSAAVTLEDGMRDLVRWWSQERNRESIQDAAE